MTSPETRQLWVGTSWKMNKTLAEADSFVDELVDLPCSQWHPAFRTAAAHGAGTGS